MVSPDSELRLDQTSDFLTPFNGSFKGRDILDISQFDKTSVDILSSACEDIAKYIEGKDFPPIFDGIFVISTIGGSFTRNNMAFESAILRFGGRQPSPTLQLPNLPDPMFYKQTQGMYESSPDLILLGGAQKGTAVEAAKHLKSVTNHIPIIDADEIDRAANEDPLWSSLDKRSNGVPLRAAILVLVLGKSTKGYDKAIPKASQLTLIADSPEEKALDQS